MFVIFHKICDEKLCNIPLDNCLGASLSLARQANICSSFNICYFFLFFLVLLLCVFCSSCLSISLFIVVYYVCYSIGFIIVLFLLFIIYYCFVLLFYYYLIIIIIVCCAVCVAVMTVKPLSFF